MNIHLERGNKVVLLNIALLIYNY